MARLADVVQVLERLERRVEMLEARLVAPREAPEPAHVIVGGKRVRLRPLPPTEWLKALQELPAFLFMYIVSEKAENKLGEEELGEVLERFYNTAKRYLEVSLAEEDRPLLADLTIPEARAAMQEVIRLNGLDEELVRFFRGQAERLAPGHGSEAVRG